LSAGHRRIEEETVSEIPSKRSGVAYMTRKREQTKKLDLSHHIAQPTALLAVVKKKQILTE
jgi:hypothetical protein